jgi:uncharacterized membrane protein
METAFRIFANYVALGCELAGVVCIALGAMGAVWRAARRLGGMHESIREARKAVFSKFAAWIILALEFALAADIVRTAIAPTWNDIGMLAAIATIRTGLNYFLERDLGALQPEPEKSVG